MVDSVTSREKAVKAMQLKSSNVFKSLRKDLETLDIVNVQTSPVEQEEQLEQLEQAEEEVHVEDTTKHRRKHSRKCYSILNESFESLYKASESNKKEKIKQLEKQIKAVRNAPGFIYKLEGDEEVGFTVEEVALSDAFDSVKQYYCSGKQDKLKKSLSTFRPSLSDSKRLCISRNTQIEVKNNNK